jgi:hypothetical protein
VSDTFVVVGATGADADLFTRSTRLMDGALGAYFHGRFDAHPREAVTVLLFGSAAPYDAYCRSRSGDKCISKFGFYAPDERRMVMNAGLGLGTLTHELVHPIVDVDFPSAPTWINEGLASLFEAPVIPRPGEIHGTRNWRLPRLIQGLDRPNERATTRLDALFGMSDEAFRDHDEDLHYAMARYACQWLDSKGMLWEFYHQWRDGFALDPTGAAAFAKAVGSSPADANEAWARWVRTL